MVYKEFEKNGKIADNVLDLFREDQEAVNKITEIMAEDGENEVDKRMLDNLINVYEKEKLSTLKTEIIQKLGNTQDTNESYRLEKELNDVIIKLANYK